MFEDAGELWKRYLSMVAETWPGNDPRHNLAGEVRDRLRQLDLILRHLNDAIDAVAPDPEAIARTGDQVRKQVDLQRRLANGEITVFEYLKAMQELIPEPPPGGWSGWIDSWDDVAIFTEAFYHWAWRLIQVLTGKAGGRYKFPGGLGRVNVPVITAVRNHLIQHPESVKINQNFTLGLVITSSGPVLRSLGAALPGDSDRIEPLSESVDQGLFVAAEQLRDELERRFDIAISRTG